MTAQPTSAVLRVPILTRSDWGAQPAKAKAEPLGRAKGIVVHHTAQGYSYAARPDVSEADGMRAVRAVQASHFARRPPFSDVGYHFVIDGAGRVFQGREYAGAGSFGPGRTPPLLSLGAHVVSKNRGRIGVNVLGCFGGGPREKNCGDKPTPAALAALTALLTALSAAYGVAPSAILGHRDLAPNICPGDDLYAALPAVRSAVKAALKDTTL